MKALVYKELKLAMHPICYVFIFMFPFMVLIPSYPLAVGFIYVLSCYPILFLGANKGQQSNDLLFPTLLPVRKKDIVLARIITVAIMQFVFIAVMSALVPVGMYITSQIPDYKPAGFGFNAYVSILAIAIVGFALADLIFLPTYYKNGKSIVKSTLLTILGFALYLMMFTVALPFIPGFEWYVDILSNKGLGIQFILLAVALLIYVGIHIAVYKISAKRLEQVDF